jgi:hypothetical protein
MQQKTVQETDAQVFSLLGSLLVWHLLLARGSVVG